MPEGDDTLPTCDPHSLGQQTDLTERLRNTGHEREADSSTSHDFSSTAVFHSHRGQTEISGGTFHATRGDMNHISIVINTHTEEANMRRSESTEYDWNVRTTPGGSTADNRIPTTVPNPDNSAMDIDDEEWLSTIPPHTSYRTYLRHMSCHGRGIPVWIPQPNRNLPIEYQRTGARIGDVVLITSRGNLRYFFNICHPADHPINQNRVPEDFSPFNVNRNDVEAFTEHRNHFSSASVKKSNRSEETGGLTFESSASEGAILTIPVGFNSEDFQPESRMKRYVDRNIGQWYKYLVNERGHELNNGDLRVVIGHDKSSLWGMAIFSSSQEQQSTNPLFLSFRPITHDNAVPIYEWLYSGSVEVKSGPDPRDIDSLRQQEPAWGGSFYENQCLFVRTLNAKMQDRRWKNLGLNSDFNMINLVPDRGPRKAATDPFVPDSMGSTGTQNETPSYQGLPNPNRRHASVHDDTMPSNILDSTLSMQQGVLEHPSDVLNDILLESKPQAEIAITYDQDWMVAIGEQEIRLPSREELRSIFLSNCQLDEEEGISFVKKHTKGHVGTLDDLPLTPHKGFLQPDTLDSISTSISNQPDFKPTEISSVNDGIPKDMGLPRPSHPTMVGSERVLSRTDTSFTTETARRSKRPFQIVLYDVRLSQAEPGHTEHLWALKIWRIRFILNFKRLPYQTVWLELQDVERTLRQIGAPPSSQRSDGRPVYTLPVIMDRARNVHQPVILANTNTIAEYLESTYPARPIFPEGARAVQTLFVHFILEVFSKPLLPIMVPLSHQQLPERTRDHLREGGPLVGPQREQAWQAVKEQFDFLAMVMDKNNGDGEGDGVVTMGREVSYADFAICSVLIWIERMAPHDGWSRVREWNGGRWRKLYERCSHYMDEL